MSAIKFLATLVAVCLTFNGCYALTGCPGSPQCDPNWVDDADGDSADDGSISKGDNGSVAETTVVEVAPTVQEVCKDFLYLEGAKWNCKWISNDPICILNLIVLKSGACGVRCPGVWKTPANTISFPTSDEMLWDDGEGSGPHTCDKVK